MQAQTYDTFIAELKKVVTGEVLSDTITLNLYSTDASIFQERPIVVVKPLNKDDAIAAIKVANAHHVPTLGRGSGTSLTGQAINHAMVLDFSVHMHQVIEVNAKQKWARVAPGVVRDVLNAQLKADQLQYGPDPATSSRATIGGMIGNNSSGTRSLIYGKVIDHIIELTLALPNGEVITVGPTTQNQYEEICLGTDTKAALYRKLKEVVHQNKDEIIARYPKTMRRTSGYALDEFTATNDWNVAKLFCGSEGTLATVLEAKINLTDLPKSTSLCVLHFQDRIEAIAAAPSIIGHNPTAIEILDDDVLTLGRNNSGTLPLLNFVEGRPDALLICEFFGESQQETQDIANAFAAKMEAQKVGYAWSTMTTSNAIANVWTLRKNCTGILSGIPAERKPIPFIEDAAIPLAHQATYIDQVVNYCKNLGVHCAMFAHVSVGLIHVRPMLDMKQETDRKLYRQIAEHAFTLVQKYNGSWSSEHGDGRSRSEFIERFYGKQIYNAFKTIKTHLDPEGLMNPGIIIDPKKMDAQLRFGEPYQTPTITTGYNYLESQSLERATEMCSGTGDCRKQQAGTMCPSFRATLDEKHSTRGRANILRLAISGQLGHDALGSQEIKTVFDLCLSCKACKSECPSNVDVARLKSEFLFQHYKTNKRPILDHMISDTRKSAARFSGLLAPIINTVKNLGVTRKIVERFIGVDQRRQLPDYTKQSFSQWFKHHTPNTKASRQIVLFEDTWMLYHQPGVGISAVTALEAFGFEVILANAGCCQRPRISKGFLDLAKRDGQQTILNLCHYINQGLDIVVCEPSCYSALTDDLPDLLGDRHIAAQLKQHIRPIEAVLLEALNNNEVPKQMTTHEAELLVHGHCHQKALYGTNDLMALLDKLPAVKAKLINAGCCGMAGSFGYEKDHYDISLKVGQERLFPAIENCPDSCTPVTTGFSCRHQIKDGTNKVAPHWLEVLYPTNSTPTEIS